MVNVYNKYSNIVCSMTFQVVLVVKNSPANAGDLREWV